MAERNVSVLIVEDQEDHAVLIKALLEEGMKDFGLNVDHVPSGEAGLEHLENNSYDICLLDFELGEGIDGVGVLETSQSKSIQTPIVMLTSAGDETVAVRAMKAGAKDYLRKELLSPESLRSTMRHTLALHEEELLRKQAQEQLQQAKDELEQKVQQLDEANKHLLKLGRLKDEFLSSVSHELRTPIANIKLSQQLAIAHPEERDKYFATLRRETERLHFIIEELLDVARMSLELRLNVATCDLNRLILLYIADRTLMAEERGLALTFSEEVGLPTVQADRMQIERVLGILLMNALNYTPSGGSIEISTHSQHQNGALWLGFTVKDDGPGISPEEQERLFERFFRGEAALNSGVPGTGLGLYMAREIVDMHGGKIEISSDGVEGKGARFTVWLPPERGEDNNRLPRLARRLMPKKADSYEDAA